MSQETTVICLDNSEWMRNGDYTPNRLEAQLDAVNLLATAKTGANPENTVGIMTLAGKRPEVLVTLTTDLSKLLSALHDINMSGEVDLHAGLQIAQLIFMNRPKTGTQAQKIVAFVGSPIKTSKEDLLTLAGSLKRNSIAVQIVHFGEHAETSEKLEVFVNAIKNSTLIPMYPSASILSDQLVTTPLFFGDAGDAGTNMGDSGVPGATDASHPTTGNAAANLFAEYGGIDPHRDPELALAMKESLEAEKK